MALQNNNAIYTGGNVKFDSTPTVNLYAQLEQKNEARRLAKQEAFDEYIRGLNTRINPAGKRTVDDPAFKYFYDKWQNFGLQNKDRLQKGDIAAQSEFNARYQDLINLVNESKQAEESKKPLVDILVDPSKRSKLSERVFPAISAHDQPLYVQDASGEYVRNTNRKQLDFSTNLFDPQFDFSKGFEGWAKGLQKEKNIGDIVSRDPVTGQVTRKYSEGFTAPQIKQIGENAARGVDDNSEIGNYYQHKFETLSNRDFDELNKDYQSVYGAEINMPGGFKAQNYIDSPQKLAAAEAIRQAKIRNEGTEAVLDRELANQRAITKIYISQSGNQPQVGNMPVGNAFDDLADYDFGKFQIKDGVFYNPDGTPKNGNVFITPAVIPSSVKSALKSGGLDPDDLNRGVDAVIQDGKIQSISNKNIGTITRAAMGGVYQPKMDTEPLKGQKLQFGGGSKSQTPKNTTYTIKGKNYTLAQLEKMGYNESQVEPYKNK